jgi:hypothetical protein
MRADFQMAGGNWISLLVSLLLAGGNLAAQTVESSPASSGSSDAYSNFLEQSQAFHQQLRTLMAEGATSKQVAQWQAENSEQIQTLQQSAETFGEASVKDPRITIRQVTIPAGTSTTLASFITTAAALATARAQIHNQLIQSLPANATNEQIQQMLWQERQEFLQQHASDIQAQAQRAVTLGSSSALPPSGGSATFAIPSDASPQMKAFLTLHNRLFAGRAQFLRQSGSSVTIREATMASWAQQNASDMLKLRALALAFSNSRSAPSSTPAQ